MSLRKYNKSGILHEAKDWVIEVDVDQQLQFPEAFCNHLFITVKGYVHRVKVSNIGEY